MRLFLASQDLGNLIERKQAGEEVIRLNDADVFVINGNNARVMR